MPDVLSGKKINKELAKKCNDFNMNKSYDAFVDLITDNPYYEDRCKCKICGGELYYENVGFRGTYQEYPKIYMGTSPISTKTIGNTTYKLCVCEKCMADHFDDWKDIKNKSRVFNRPTKYAQFAFDIPDNVINEKNLELCVRSLESFTKKYGEEEGKKRWDSYVEKQRVTNTFEYKKEKYGMTLEQFDEYNKSRSCTVENFINRYGEEEGLKRWNNYIQREAYCNTRVYFIETYGEDEGIKKWNNFNNARFINRSYSMISQDLFRTIIQNDIFKDHEIYFAEYNYEYEVYTDTGHLYYLDFYDKTLNLCIEFNGIKFHPKPGKYKETDVFDGLFESKGKLVGDIWKYEREREKDIKYKLGARIITVWEDDYKHNKLKTINDLILSIKNICNG